MVLVKQYNTMFCFKLEEHLSAQSALSAPAPALACILSLFSAVSQGHSLRVDSGAVTSIVGIS